MTIALKLNHWYERFDDTPCMLVVEYPWYHIRRWMGYRFRDNDGHYRTSKGKLSNAAENFRDIRLTDLSETPN